MDKDIIIQLIGILSVAFSGYKLKSLTKSGAILTIIIGIAVAAGFGYQGLFLLGIFFVTSSLWSKYKSEKKASIQQKVQKGEQRDYIQVLANGGVPALAGILHTLSPADIWLYLFIGAIASANADTWASEIGSLSKRNPLLITSFKRVDRGTSGAISFLGSLSALAGSLLIIGAAFYFWNDLSVFAIIVLALTGFLGNWIDTFLGAVIQVSYICEKCGFETEKSFHCNQKTRYYKGVTFCNNDFINVISIFFASMVGALFLSYFS
ncbi:DUF92 domain-containing protein [Litchfieldia alkalitelluris]|uniref:DUF92 domain-containing protein n=1 Tax=Litchfieldia alkalitelluris TaxID=304268 RepID=UPI0009963340|nr:DUF92 domain-containing protein [Litchfieldia alkalitelluris]